MESSSNSCEGEYIINIETSDLMAPIKIDQDESKWPKEEEREANLYNWVIFSLNDLEKMKWKITRTTKSSIEILSTQ